MMRYDEVLTLIGISYTQDELLQPVENYTKRKVYANAFTVGRDEFSMAGQVGLRADLAFQVNSIDYSGEEAVEHSGQLYKVYRVAVSGDRTTIYLQKDLTDGKR